MGRRGCERDRWVDFSHGAYLDRLYDCTDACVHATITLRDRDFCNDRNCVQPLMTRHLKIVNTNFNRFHSIMYQHQLSPIVTKIPLQPSRRGMYLSYTQMLPSGSTLTNYFDPGSTVAYVPCRPVKILLWKRR
jgi:hypothetical protein